MSDWIEWVATEGSVCPVDPDTIVQLQLSDDPPTCNHELEYKAGAIRWSKDGSRNVITKYRVVSKPTTENPMTIKNQDPATAKQPTPTGTGKPILGMVLADLTNRALEGKEKYGEPLLAHNGHNALWDAYQEALDLAMYLRQAIEEQRNETI